jgi:hypothetical protein
MAGRPMGGGGEREGEGVEEGGETCCDAMPQKLSLLNILSILMPKLNGFYCLVQGIP